ncbi:MAG: bifunctional adenosylcobinamide kinase/adenosylcobinamide-phosphate guanylyltransferase [Spirochaetes bacterium]|nr:bifunctional adenosylcobinamide kinase/adenosylcobinamide-phosphate guanylyltransferase [Spirochaetota bacterium]
MNKMIFISGGARSGKSTLAETLTKELNNLFKNNKKIAYIATAELIDKEFEERIEKHKNRRGNSYITYEESINIDLILNEIYQYHNVFVLECLTTWLGNIYHRMENIIYEEFIDDRLNNIFSLFLNKKYSAKDYNQSKMNLVIKSGLNINNGIFNDLFNLNENDKTIILVSNEAGSGIVPDNIAARDFRDMLGRINQITAYMSDFVYHCIYGIPVRLK